MMRYVERADSVLKTGLKITDAQLPQWNTFADSLPKQCVAVDRDAGDEADGAASDLHDCT